MVVGWGVAWRSVVWCSLSLFFIALLLLRFGCENAMLSFVEEASERASVVVRERVRVHVRGPTFRFCAPLFHYLFWYHSVGVSAPVPRPNDHFSGGANVNVGVDVDR